MTTVVLADDHQIVRLGIRTILEEEPDVTVVGEAADGFAAISLVEHMQPDVLITDLSMPGLNGLELTQILQRKSPTTRIILLSIHADESYTQSARENGAYGYIVKQASADDIIHAVREVAAGRYYFPPTTATTLPSFHTKEPQNFL
jgi:DNA-binding NarL/FixJ family response regulator